jgi:hypothetical protein
VVEADKNPWLQQEGRKQVVWLLPLLPSKIRWFDAMVRYLYLIRNQPRQWRKTWQ